MKAKAGDVYTVYNKYLKRYTACQVAYITPPDGVSKQPRAVVLSLDWVGDAPLTAEELPQLRPLYKDFMYWHRELHLLRVSVEVPPQYTLVGTLPPFTDELCSTYGSWNDGYDVYLQMKWQEIPEERRRAFKEAMESDAETEIGSNLVKISSHRVMDKYTPFGSALELELLPCLSDIICEQWHPDLIEFLRGNPFIHELTLLNHSQKSLDLRGTSVGKLMLDMTGLEELWLGEETEQLLFQNEGPDTCTIYAAGCGSGLTLQFIGGYRPHPELSGLWGLHGIRLKDFDLSALTAVHPHLKELRLWGAPGNLQNFSAVAQFRELTDLSTFDLFGFDAADPRADTRASLVLDDQPAGDGSTSGKAALERQAGNGPADHQAPKAGVVGAKSGQSLPGLGRRGAYPCRRCEKGSPSIPQDPLPADEAGQSAGRGRPGAGGRSRLYPGLQQDGLYRNRGEG